MLNGALALHDVSDTERFCAGFLQRLPQWRQLTSSHRDDALSYAIGETWRLSTRYDPARNSSFSKFAYAYQGRFFVQYLRDTFVDQRYGDADAEARDSIAFPASLDAPVDGHVDDGGAGLLGELVSVRGGGDPSDSDSALERAHRDRHRFRARDLHVLHQKLSEAA